MSHGVKVPQGHPDHDSIVSEAIHRAQGLCEDRDLDAGIGILEYDDVTVVVISDSIPRREVFQADMSGQTDPHAEGPDLRPDIDIHGAQG